MKLFVTDEESNTWVGGGVKRVVGGFVVCTQGENMLIELEALFETKPSVASFHRSPAGPEESGAERADGSGFLEQLNRLTRGLSCADCIFNRSNSEELLTFILEVKVNKS